VHCRPSGEPFYVGKGHGSRGYDLTHWKRIRNKHHRNIVAKYGKENILIYTRNCESENQAKVHEVWMIAWCRLQGYRLTNQTDGGEGTSGFKMPVEIVKRLGKLTSIRMRGNQFRKGVHQTEEEKEKHSQANIGKQNSLGHKHTPEWCVAQSKRTRSAWTPERRAAQAERMCGNKNTLGTKHSLDWCAAASIRMSKRMHDNKITLGRIWINNGLITKMVKDKIPTGWKKGRMLCST
jgi:hypothetical protein